MVFSDEVVFQTKFRATAKLHIRRSEKRDEVEIVTKLPQVGEVALYPIFEAGLDKKSWLEKLETPTKHYK